MERVSERFLNERDVNVVKQSKKPKWTIILLIRMEGGAGKRAGRRRSSGKSGGGESSPWLMTQEPSKQENNEVASLKCWGWGGDGEPIN